MQVEQIVVFFCFVWIAWIEESEEEKQLSPYRHRGTETACRLLGFFFSGVGPLIFETNNQVNMIVCNLDIFIIR